MDGSFLKQRIESTKAQILALDDAITQITAGYVESYTIDTGQTRQTVTRANLASYQRVLDSLENRLATLQQRLDGRSTTNGMAAWYV